MTTETVDECAQRLVRDDVLVCLSSLIWELNKAEVGAQLDVYDELLELSGRHDYETAVREHLATVPAELLRERLVEVEIAAPEEWSQEDLADELFDYLKHAGELAQFCDDHEIEPSFDEVYEHWAVTGWLAAKLRDQGEVVAEMFNMNVWGRCTTGQALYMDGVMQRIAADLLSH